jgi:4-azaleucine resistance transporter AzlC
MNSPARKAFLAGVKAVIPLLVGVSPFGMIYGVLAMGAGIPPIASQAISSIVFAGSAQFVLAQLVAAGTPALVMVLTIVVVNLRHALYSASIAPYMVQLPRSWKAGLAYLLTDEAYAVTILNYEKEEPDHKHLFFLGAGLGLWTCWQISTAAGILLGEVVPAEWSLDFALPLTFMAIVLPALKNRADVAAAMVAAVTAVLAFGMPYKLGLITAAFSGILAGLLVEGRK